MTQNIVNLVDTFSQNDSQSFSFLLVSVHLCIWPHAAHRLIKSNPMHKSVDHKNHSIERQDYWWGGKQKEMTNIPRLMNLKPILITYKHAAICRVSNNQLEFRLDRVRC